MGIYKQHLVFLTASGMDDSDNGGGLPSNTFVVNGNSNQVFDDVTSLQRASGGVSLRSIWATVNTETNQKLLASYIAITKPPSNPNVSLFAFEVDKYVSYRSDAENKITAYLSAGTRMAGHLLEKHLAGQQSIQLSLNKKDVLPKVGDSIVLVQNEGQSDEFKQFLHVSNVTSTVRQFEINANRTVERMVATLEVSQGLDRQFNGLTVPEFYANIDTSRRCIVRETNVVSANKIYSASKLSTPITANTTNQMVIDTIFTQVVPSTTSPEPLPNLNPALEQDSLVISGDNVSVDKIVTVTAGQLWFVGSGIYPSSFLININGTDLHDENGVLVDNTDTQWGNINYEIGSVDWIAGTNIGNTRITGTYKPAGKISQFGNTDSITVPKTGAVKLFTKRLQQSPARLSLTVSYQYNNNIYILKDDGNGNLYSPSGNGGAGSIDYVTKDIQITTSAIPDSESEIIISYGIDTNTYRYTNTPAQASIIIPIPDKTIIANTLNIDIAGQTVTASADGNLTGAGSGYVVGGIINVTPNNIPAKNTAITVIYTAGETKTFTKNHGTSNSDTFTVTGTGAINTGSISISLSLAYKSQSISMTLKDDGNGNLVVASHDAVVGFASAVGANAGTVNYTTRQITVNPSMTRSWTETRVIGWSGGNVYIGNVETATFNKSETISLKDSSPIITNYSDTATTTPVSITHTVDALTVVLPSNSGGSKIINGSINMSLNGLSYFDQDNTLYHSLQNDGTKTESGTVNYQNGVAILSDWQIGVNTANVLRMATKENQPPINNIVFRTPLAPILIGQMQVSAETEDGTAIQLTVDNQSKFTGSTLAHGTFSYQNGIANLIFYEKVLDNATAQAQPWHLSSLVYDDNGTNYINKPIYVKPESITYTAVATKYTPLDKSVIGVDPARLPLDGRVPFIKTGDFVLITEDLTYALASPAPNKTYNTNITRQTDITIIDSAGKELVLADINANLDAGTFNLTNDFDVNNYTLPLTATIRISDIGVATNVDISGRVTINQQITHDYSTDAVVSSVLVNNGNQGLQVKAYNFFTQSSWDGVFDDSPRNARADIQYNDSAFPAIVSNRSTPTDRLAFVFKSPTTVDVIAEELGTLAQNVDITQDFTVINPVTGNPMIKLFAQGWSSGGAVNNVLRVNLQSVNKQIWLGSAIQPHNGNNSDVYDYQIEHLADTDRER